MTMYDLMSLIKALADENRVRLLAALDGRELCVCQLIELIELAPSTVSKHLSILRSARLIEGRKDGRWMHYRIADGALPEAGRTALAWLREATRDNQRILTDRKRLEQIATKDPDASCRRDSQKAANA
jgi:ArsR family transcriptional regulator, arsenate/arsenite/antimonite-responsive transcriptional repressor